MNIYESNPQRDTLSQELSQLEDVELTSPSDGQVLSYNGATEKWENKSSSSASPTPQALGFGYGTDSTASNVTAKVTTVDGFALTKNGYVSVKFANDVPASATLNVSNTGAKAIYYEGQALSANIIGGGDTATFIYDGTRFNVVALDHSGGGGGAISELSDTLISNVQNNQVLTWDSTQNKWVNKESAASPESIGIGYGTCSTASSTAAKVVTLSGYELVKNGIVSVMFSNAITGAATMNINNKGAKSIFFKGVAITAGVINAGVIATFSYDGTNYNLISVDDTLSAYTPNDTAENTLADGDYFPFYDVSASAKRKTLWSNIVSKIKSAIGKSDIGLGNVENIDQSKAVKSITRSGTTFTATCLDNTTFNFDQQDNNTTYTPQSLGFGYGTCTTAAATAAKVATLADYVLVKNGNVSIKFNNAVPASATLNINGKGAKAIYYRGSAITAGIIGAGDLATFVYDGSYYQLIALDKGGAGGTFTYLTQTLAANATSITFSNSAITATSLIDVYTDKAGLDYTSITGTTGSVTLTFEAQSSATTVKLAIREQ